MPLDPAQRLILNGSSVQDCLPHLQLSEQQLLSLPQQHFSTKHTWSAVAQTFSGPLLETVLKLVCPQSQPVYPRLYLRALNDYSIVVDFKQIQPYQPILALKVDGKALELRDKGPLWIMLDFSRFKQIPERSLDEMLVWQLYYIAILNDL